MARKTNDGSAYGKTVWSRHPLLVPSRRRFCWPDRVWQNLNPLATVTRRIRRRGERGISRKTIARECRIADAFPASQAEAGEGLRSPGEGSSTDTRNGGVRPTGPEASGFLKEIVESASPKLQFRLFRFCRRCPTFAPSLSNDGDERRLVEETSMRPAKTPMKMLLSCFGRGRQAEGMT
jgi:hypothetical protein